MTYFVTFRASDSVPAGLAAQWRRDRARWLREHGVDPDAADWKAGLASLPGDASSEFQQTFTEEFDHYLDRGLGACVLRRPELAEIVARSFHKFDNDRYYLGDFVVMPNHVHLLCCLIGDTNLEAQCESWKHFTARKINAALATTGRFWQQESFDHLVRSPEQFDYFAPLYFRQPTAGGSARRRVPLLSPRGWRVNGFQVADGTAERACYITGTLRVHVDFLDDLNFLAEHVRMQLRLKRRCN